MSENADKEKDAGCIVMILITSSLVIGHVMLFLLQGCSVTPSPQYPSGEGWRTLKSADGTYQVGLHIPEPIPLNEEFTARGWVQRDGRPVADSVIVQFDGGMPQHGHGLAVPVETNRQEQGFFSADGVRFHMGGRWLLTVDVQDGPHLERAREWVEIR